MPTAARRRPGTSRGARARVSRKPSAPARSTRRVAGKAGKAGTAATPQAGPGARPRAVKRILRIHAIPLSDDNGGRAPTFTAADLTDLLRKVVLGDLDQAVG